VSFFLDILLSLTVVLAQATFSTVLSVKGIQPDLCFVLACVTGYLSGEYKGLRIGLIVGLFQDLLAPGGIGLNMMLKGLAGGLAGMMTHTVSTVTGPAILLVTLALSLGCGLASLVVAYPVVDTLVLLYAFSSMLLPHACYNSILTLGVFWLNHKIGVSMTMTPFVRGHR
jgi:cell shape-determining protein MreD